MRNVTRLATVMAVLLMPMQVLAWSRPTHMVTASIAYRMLATQHPRRLQELLDILAAHPDRGPFEVAIDRAIGDEQQRRLFYECARWPDDARGTPYDHPTWHYAARPIIRDAQAPKDPEINISGAAFEAFALNLRVLNDPIASKPERAVALCWVMHLVGDIHQPLHNAQLFSSTYPNGDRLGSLQFVRERATDRPVTLHWFWDDRVHREGSIETVEAAADRIRSQSASKETIRPPFTSPVDAFHRWSEESYAIAIRDAYGSDLRNSPDVTTAPPMTDRYRSSSADIAAKRVSDAGTRLASVLLYTGK